MRITKRITGRIACFLRQRPRSRESQTKGSPFEPSYLATAWWQRQQKLLGFPDLGIRHSTRRSRQGDRLGIAIKLAAQVAGELLIIAELEDRDPRRSENRVERPRDLIATIAVQSRLMLKTGHDAITWWKRRRVVQTRSFFSLQLLVRVQDLYFSGGSREIRHRNWGPLGRGFSDGWERRDDGENEEREREREREERRKRNLI
ncbi:hypothetical protein TIFTF001_032462 [Ficus carica]|uniref:Uncharacterized protein n=1 Tax=Ficus carica TaxID=3494 RepID=A0AA88DX83_FICCA|nr:hypothetical protein TIFTF001_032462 [Ficus carica]